MDEKTPRERLRESLRENSERVREWPEWLRAAISTAEVFSVPPVKADGPRRDEPR
jgi:hypothetical protein